MNNELLTIPHILRFNSDNYSSQIALREKKFGVWKTKTWTECYNEIRYISLGLCEKGVKAESVVGILGNNTVRWLLGEIAIQSIKCMPMGIYSDALENEIDYLIDYSKCAVVFVEDEEQADKILSLRDSKSKIKLIIFDEEKGMNKYNDKRLISYKQLIDIGKIKDTNFPLLYNNYINKVTEKDACILCPTSGTTANPKLAIIEHGKLIKHTKSYLIADPKSDTDNYVSVLPLPWIIEQKYAVAKWCICRMKVNFVEETETMLDDLREIGPTFLLLAPRVWEQLAADIRSKIMDSSLLKKFLFNFSMKLMELNNKFLNKIFCELLLNKWLRDSLGFSYLKSAATGGASLGPDTFKFFVNIGIPLRQLYGQTEQLGAWTIHKHNQIDFDSVGFPFPGVDFKIHNPDNEGIGEIKVKNDNTMRGYLGKDEPFLLKGWFYTGDAGYINNAGHLVVIDRMSDLSYTSEKLRYSPQYIENKLKFSTYISEAAVIGSNKPYLSAIICIRFSVLSKWAENKRIGFTTYSDLATKKEIEELIIAEVTKVNLTLPSKQKIKKFVLLYKEFDADDDELTRTRKLRRSFVIEKYSDIVNAIYLNNRNIDIDTSIKLQDGGIQKIRTKLSIIKLA